MTTRKFISIAVLGIIVALTACQSAPTLKTILLTNYTAAWHPTLDNFKSEMTRLGWIEGKNVAYIASGDLTKTDDIRPFLDTNAAKADLLVCMSTPVTAQCGPVSKEKNKPGLFIGIYDPVSIGVVAAINKPDGQMTGIWHGISDAKRLEWVMTILPKKDKYRFYMPFNPKDASALASKTRISEAAAKYGNIEIVTRECPDPAAQDACAVEIPEGIDVYYLPWDNALGSRVAKTYAVASVRKIPIIGLNETYAQAGALLSYGFSLASAGTQGARMADRILKGSKISDMPVEAADFVLSFNNAVAADLGITIPDTILAQANSIYRVLPGATPTATEAATASR